MGDETATPRGRAIIQTCAALKGDRQTYISLCDEISLYFAPEQETLLEVTAGSEVLQPIISSGILANQKCQSGLYSNSMAMGKGNISSNDKRQMEVPIIKEWYAELSNQTHHHISQSSFPQSFNKWLTDYVPFGGAVMYLRWDEDTYSHEYQVFPIGKCFYTFDHLDRVNAMYREYDFTSDQAVGEFGYNQCPKVVRVAYDKDDYKTKFGFVHCLRENKKADPDSKHWSKMQYESLHVHVTTGKLCHESGTKHFRYIVEHFYQKHGENNGRSPGMQALPVMRTLMKSVSDYIDGTEMAIGPPMWLSDRDAVESAILEAFGVNYADLSKGDPWMYKIDANALRLSSEFIEWLRSEIDDLFYVPLFTMLEQSKSGAKTAYEVSQMVAERTQAIAPIANSLSRFFRRVYYITAHDLIAAGQITPAPEGIEQSDIDVKYTSRLDVRLKEIENVSMMEAIGQAAETVAAFQQSPEIQAVVRIIPTIISIFESHNVDPGNIRNQTEAKKELDGINQAMADAKQEETAAAGLAPIDLAKEPDPNSMLGGMVEAGAGGMIGQ